MMHRLRVLARAVGMPVGLAGLLAAAYTVHATDDDAAFERAGVRLARQEFRSPVDYQAGVNTLVQRRIDATLCELQNPSFKAGRYVVLEGPKGSGKSLAVLKAIDKRRGVVYVCDPPAHNLLSAILEAASPELARLATTTTSKCSQLFNFFWAAKEHLADQHLLPLLVIELERATPDLVDAVTHLGKYLAPVCRVLIVASDARLSADAGRHVLHLGDYLPDEAEQILQTRYSHEQIAHIIATIGAKPADLAVVVSDGFEEHCKLVENRVCNATVDLLIDHPEYRRLLAALVAQPSMNLTDASSLVGVSSERIISDCAGVLSVDLENLTVSASPAVAIAMTNFLSC
jgi:hypothetical protein